ncbi:hypothetical protein Godav_012943, partial [Gossypium davidsonii]|nr:hypothetical protein [Gossypium davidsonii]MBA0647469.1 hypothetical protein [Gossypium klotzschianum]
MKESIMQVTEKNVIVRDWSLRTQKAKGDNLKEGYISDLPGHMTSNARQNNLKDLTRIWKQWYSDIRGIFTEKYGDIAHLIAINEYAALLCVDNVQFNKIYVKEPKLMTFKKKLMKLTGMTDTWAKKYIKKKNEVSCVPWFSLRESLSSCKRKREGRFIGWAQLLNAWIFSHFWKHWVLIFWNLRAEDITWRAPWIRPSVLLYKCRNQDWVSLLGLWGEVGYALLI